MEILRSISLYTEDKDMPFLVIGGHAINSHGISRQTGDLDLMVPLRTKPLWFELMNKLRYKEGQSDERFSRFKSLQLDNWPIDLMYVDDKTFESIYTAGLLAAFSDATFNESARAAEPLQEAALPSAALVTAVEQANEEN